MLFCNLASFVHQALMICVLHFPGPVLSSLAGILQTASTIVSLGSPLISYIAQIDLPKPQARLLQALRGSPPLCPSLTGFSPEHLPVTGAFCASIKAQSGASGLGILPWPCAAQVGDSAAPTT